jgi:hypothetical protein
MGWRNLSKTAEKEVLQPMRSECALRSLYDHSIRDFCLQEIYKQPKE